MSLGSVAPASGAATLSEAKGLGWIATCGFLYAASAMIASLANILVLAVAASHAGVRQAFAVASFSALLGAVGWLMALPALILLALGLYELGRSGAEPRKDVRNRWIGFAAGVALFAATVPLVVMIAEARTVDVGLVLLEAALGLGSAVLLLATASLPALHRGERSWREPARIALLLGLAAAATEGAASIVVVTSIDLPLLANWAPIAWGFPASILVLASAFVLGWRYSSLMKAAKTQPAAPAV